MERKVIEMLNITKSFPGVIANDHVSITLHDGEILALLGENGAGKSTLMSILFGLYEPDSGEIRVNGKPVKIHDPNEATKLGIGMVHQHFKLVQNFTVLENVVLGAETTAAGGILKMKEARKKVIELSDRYHFHLDPDMKIEDISVGQQQRVEIIKMLYRNNDILIFDEPTAVLTPQEIDELMDIMRQLVQEGKSILFITHKLNEIKAVADTVTILRKGKLIDTRPVADVSIEEMSRLMVGHKVNLNFDLGEPEVGKDVIQIQNLSLNHPRDGQKPLHDISFHVKEGEIVCIAGVDGNGQSELIGALTGLIDNYSGKILLNGEDVSNKNIRYRNTHGISHVPEDRHKYGLILDYNLAKNLVLQSYFLPEFQNHGMIRENAVKKYSEKLIAQYDVRAGQGTETTTRSMSGGNQQKAIIARELEREHNLLIAVQPTRGLDVGAISYIHQQIIAERNAGKAVLLVSFELNEVLGISDRILVMHSGEIVADVKPSQTDEQELGLYMSGAKRMEGLYA
ncbi:MAG: ABC transporter ATP-binding protein [Peptoniphilaceae bacterium]|nr:ABC transporter ATP-binding protein [Peptoniphilaceae bacterium]